MNFSSIFSRASFLIDHSSKFWVFYWRRINAGKTEAFLFRRCIFCFRRKVACFQFSGRIWLSWVFKLVFSTYLVTYVWIIYFFIGFLSFFAIWSILNSCLLFIVVMVNFHFVGYSSYSEGLYWTQRVDTCVSALPFIYSNYCHVSVL